MNKELLNNTKDFIKVNTVMLLAIIAGGIIIILLLASSLQTSSIIEEEEPKPFIPVVCPADYVCLAGGE